jgi:hypothetical protein
LQDELNAVSNLTGGYAGLRETIQEVIDKYEQLMESVNTAQNNQ